jgi:hypothetical protein
MNYLAAEKIRARENRGKWISFVGSAHVNTYDGVPGLAELTGTLSIIPAGRPYSIPSGTKESPSVKVNVKNYLGEIDRVDIVYCH